MGPGFRVSSERLEKPGIKPTTPGLEGEQLNHYATEASLYYPSRENKGADQLRGYLFCLSICKKAAFS